MKNQHQYNATIKWTGNKEQEQTIIEIMKEAIKLSTKN